MQNALAAAADEMGAALYRTAYSTIVRDCLDYSTSLCNANGQMIAQGVTIPLHLGSVPYALDALLERFGDDIDPGDVFIMNDPFDGGMHIPDIFIVQPIFWEGERVAFAVSTAHHLDLGGRLPGSSACDNTEIYQEGIRIPWLKLYRRGEPEASIFALIRANVRVPQMTIGDIRAQLAACHMGERAVHALIERYGPETFLACAQDLIDYTERLVRAEIASWPDGSNTFTDFLDSDGVGGPRVRIRVTVTVRGDSLTGRFHGDGPPGARRRQQYALVYRSRRGPLRARRNAGGDSEYGRNVPAAGDHRARGYAREREDAGRVVDARRDRVPDDGRRVRGAGRAAARPCAGRRRRRQHAGHHRRTAAGPVALRLL